MSWMARLVVLRTWRRLGYASQGELLPQAGWAPLFGHSKWVRGTWLSRIYWLDVKVEAEWLNTMAKQYGYMGWGQEKTSRAENEWRRKALREAANGGIR